MKIKQTILAAILVTTAMATTTTAATASSVEHCGDIENVAKLIMSNRQAGVPLKDMVDFAQGVESGADLLIMLTLDAYNEPAYRTAEHRARAEQEFANKWFMTCLKALNSI